MVQFLVDVGVFFVDALGSASVGSGLGVGGNLFFVVGDLMMERTFTVLNKMGLHARPAAMLVQLLQKFESSILLRKDDQEVDGKSIMGILTLTAEFGSKLTVVADGADESSVMNSVSEFFNHQMHDE